MFCKPLRLLAPCLIAAFIATMASGSVFAQTVSLSSATVGTGAGSAEITWSLNGGPVLEGLAFDIQFDNDTFTPELTNCLEDAPVGTKSCEIEAPGVIRVGLLDLAGNPLGSQSGSIVFTFDSSATPGIYELELSEDVANTTPAGTTVTLNDGSITLQLIQPALTRTPASLNFTTENGATSAAQTVTVTNSGNQDGLLITGATVSSGSRFNVASNNCPSTTPGLAQDETCTIGVTFSPNAIDSFSDTLTITSNAGNATVALTGEGTAGPAGALTIAPTSHNFGTLLTDQGTATQSFTVTNSGAAGSVVTVGTPAIAGAGMTIVSGNTCASATLAQGASCSVTVQFAPAADGAVSGGELTVSGTDANSTSLSASATLSGAGETKAIFRSTPAAGSTQTEVAGAEGEASFTISLFNDGNASYAFTSALTSGDSDIFTITGGSGTVAAFSGGSAGSSTITVSCELPDFETYEGTVTVTVGDETYEYGFTCVGRPPLPVPTMSVWSLSLMALMLMLMAGFGMRTMRARR